MFARWALWMGGTLLKSRRRCTNYFCFGSIASKDNSYKMLGEEKQGKRRKWDAAPPGAANQLDHQALAAGGLGLQPALAAQVGGPPAPQVQAVGDDAIARAKASALAVLERFNQVCAFDSGRA